MVRSYGVRLRVNMVLSSLVLVAGLSVMYERLFMSPTSKNLEGYIASGTFVRPSVRASITLFDA